MLRRIAIVLVLAVAVNIAVAVACAMWSPTLGNGKDAAFSPIPSATEAQWLQEVGSTPEGQWLKSVGEWKTDPDIAWQYGRQDFFSHDEHVGFGLSTWDLQLNLRAIQGRIERVRCGWPLLCLDGYVRDWFSLHWLVTFGGIVKSCG